MVVLYFKVFFVYDFVIDIVNDLGWEVFDDLVIVSGEKNSCIVMLGEVVEQQENVI